MLDRRDVRDGLIDRYLRQQLSVEELAAFEIRLLEDPELFEAVQETELMHQAFELTGDKAGDEGDSGARKTQPKMAVSTTSKVSYLPFRLWIKQPMSLAASVMLGIGVLLVTNLSTQPTGSEGLQSGYGVNSVVSIGQTRSAAGETVLPTGTHLLQVDVGISLSDSSYMLSLSNDEDGHSHEFQVTADGNGMVRVLTPANLQGLYQLRVQQQGSTDVLASYSLRFE